MTKEKDNNVNGIIIAVVILLAVVYYTFKYLGDWLGYILMIIGISYIIYNYFKKNLTKITYRIGFIFIGLSLISFTLSYFLNYSDCECYKVYIGEMNSSIFGKGEVDRRGYDECLEKWHDEVIEGDYKSDNKAVYTDPVQYFGEKCDDKN
jgi:hypothetical protein